MLNILICLGGIFTILQAGEWLWRRNILKGEYLRKFVHISSACFIATWPWLISWTSIQLIALVMLLLVMYNQRHKVVHMDGDLKRQTYGELLFAVAVGVCALLTDQNAIFALAVLHLGLADGLAAVSGKYLRNRLSYRVFGYRKTVYGSMVFWLMSLLIFWASPLIASDLFSLNDYLIMMAILPPALTALENLSVKGFDNLTVPVAVVLALRLLA